MNRTAMETVKEFYSYINTDPSALPNVLHTEIIWEIITGFPYGGEYNGLTSVMEDFFGKVMQHFEFWNDLPNEYIEAGDKIIVLGHYKTRAKGADSDVMPSFTNLWTVDNGMITRLQQYTDTTVLSEALGDDIPH